VALRLPVICIVTRARGRADSAERASLLGRLAAAATAGATMVQVRERQFDDRQLLVFMRQVIAAIRPAGALALVNDRTDVALAAGADGVHLKSDGPAAEDVRRIVPEGFVIGRSVHSEEEAAGAARSGACDYLLFGTVFHSASKPDDHATTGIGPLAQVCRRVAVPVLAIGGVSVDRAPEIAAAGAAGVAAISLFSEADDIVGTVAALAAALTLPARRV
jgi:thiamine-phosphate pyrophosphorylase